MTGPGRGERDVVMVASGPARDLLFEECPHDPRFEFRNECPECLASALAAARREGAEEERKRATAETNEMPPDARRALAWLLAHPEEPFYSVTGQRFAIARRSGTEIYVTWACVFGEAAYFHEEDARSAVAPALSARDGET